MDGRADLFRWMVESSADGLWMLDASGMTTFANRRMAELLGRKPEEMAGFSAYDAFDEPGRASLREHLAELEAAADSDSGEDKRELRLVRPDGSVVWTLASHFPVRDDEGHRIGWLHRVTENPQKELVDKLRNSEQQLAVAQSIAAIGSWEWDVPTDIVTWSDELYRIYNVSPEEFEATYEGFLEFVHPDDRELVMRQVGSLFEGADEFAWEARIIRKGGEVRWVRGLGVAERGPDGQPVKMSGTAQDITDRVNADHIAAEATRRLHLLQQMATAANQTNSLAEALELMAVGLPLFTSWAAVCAYRVDGGELLEIELVEGGLDRVCEPDLELAQRCRETRQVEVMPCPGLEDTHTLVALPVLLDGEVSCVLEVLADESPIDENSRTLIEQISSQVSQVAQRERNALQLAEARDQAMEASRLKSEFLATMSHEIRTPMNGVIGLTGLLLRTKLDDHQQRLAEGLQDAGLTLLGIINDILDLSKIEAGKLELEAFDFDVRAVFEKTADVLSGRAHEKGIELVVACHPDVPAYLRGDPVRLGQVLTNLGANAVKFTATGEVAVRATVHEESPDEVVLRVDVSDTGAGIDTSGRVDLFDAFTQADSSTTREHGGTGLGLAIARQLVAAMGGEIWVDSELGRGSTFSFTAGFGRATSTPAAPGRGDPGALIGRKVLVVDDNLTNRLILEDQLSAWGMEPVSVATVDEAMTALRTAADAGTPYEFALLDLYLPDGDGLTLARAIRAGTAHQHLALLLLSSGHHVDSAGAREAGIAAILTKPVRQSELYDSLVSIGSPATAGRPASATATAPAPGPKVLVVEDNEVNQMVAVGLLENAGYEVDVVDDGVEAVAALAPGHGYAAVLMDCRMPRLDGFDATRQIRSAEPEGHRVPIIAMTASALEGEEERCLEAGMDDFLTKPVDPPRLYRVLGSWVDGRDAADSGEEQPPPPATADVLDVDRMRDLDELVKDGVSLFERTARNFVENAPEHLRAIHGAVTTADPALLVATAHKLKGSALNLGLPRVGAAAGALESLGDTGSTSGAGQLLDTLERELGQGIAALRDVRQRGL